MLAVIGAIASPSTVRRSGGLIWIPGRDSRTVFFDHYTFLTPGVAFLTLDAVGANPTFNLFGPLHYTETNVNASDPALVNLAGAAGPVTVNMADKRAPGAQREAITGYGGHGNIDRRSDGQLGCRK